MQTYKILGFTESNNTCDCCGRSELKGTYAVELEEGILYYGSTCVKRNLGLKKDKDINNSIEKYKQEIRLSARDFYKSLGGYDIEFKMQNLDFLSDEWNILDVKSSELKNKTKLKFKISHF